MALFTGHMAWEFFRGRYLARIEAALGRSLTPEERRAFADDAHRRLVETSLMLLLRPDLVDAGYRDPPPARYPLSQRLRPNYPLRGQGQGYVGDPARADVTFAKAILEGAGDRGGRARPSGCWTVARGSPPALAVPAHPAPAHRFRPVAGAVGAGSPPSGWAALVAPVAEAARQRRDSTDRRQPPGKDRPDDRATALVPAPP
jgi:hypothetical protein